jgi:hypothetical protein
MIAGFDTDHEIMHEDDDTRFRRDSEDVLIISVLARENPKPVFLTSDLNMRSRYPHERKALAESGLTIVFFRKTFHNLPVHAQAMKLLKAWPELVEAASRCRIPTAFEVTTNGKIEEIGPTASI